MILYREFCLKDLIRNIFPSISRYILYPIVSIRVLLNLLRTMRFNLNINDKTINATDIFSMWKGDRQEAADYLQKFLTYNHDALVFLGIEYEMSTSEIALVLKASQLVGCAPLISPVTGKQCGNIIVKSEYQDDIDDYIDAHFSISDAHIKKEIKIIVKQRKKKILNHILLIFLLIIMKI